MTRSTVCAAIALVAAAEAALAGGMGNGNIANDRSYSLKSSSLPFSVIAIFTKCRIPRLSMRPLARSLKTEFGQ